MPDDPCRRSIGEAALAAEESVAAADDGKGLVGTIAVNNNSSIGIVAGCNVTNTMADNVGKVTLLRAPPTERKLLHLLASS